MADNTGQYKTGNNVKTTELAEKLPLAAIANIATADANDEATAIALANANKAKINALLTALRTAGIIAPNA